MAVSGGVDGLLIETHYDPDIALCDGKQMINPKELGEFYNIYKKARDIDGRMMQ